jgi:small subunit ribosomal protein S20
LANTKQAKKRAIQAEKHRKHNASMRSLFRSSVKKVINAIATKDQNAAFAALKAATPIIDRMVGKGIVHKNKAARHKSRLIAHIRKLSEDNVAA